MKLKRLIPVMEITTVRESSKSGGHLRPTSSKSVYENTKARSLSAMMRLEIKGSHRRRNAVKRERRNSCHARYEGETHVRPVGRPKGREFGSLAETQETKQGTLLKQCQGPQHWTRKADVERLVKRKKRRNQYAMK